VDAVLGMRIAFRIYWYCLPSHFLLLPFLLIEKLSLPFLLFLLCKLRWLYGDIVLSSVILLYTPLLLVWFVSRPRASQRVWWPSRWMHQLFTRGDFLVHHVSVKRARLVLVYNHKNKLGKQSSLLTTSVLDYFIFHFFHWKIRLFLLKKAFLAG
jgi:hypothetical protein